MYKETRAKTPVILISGYLGAGKTTLVNEILKEQMDRKIAVIVNDMGAVNIDASLINSQSITKYNDMELIQLQNGCICCSLQEEFMEQIIGLSGKGFDSIMVEASGISDPGSVAEAFLFYEESGRETGAVLNNIVTVVDADRIYAEFLEKLKNLSETEKPDVSEEEEEAEEGDPDIINLIMDQIEFCNVILLNKCDLLTGKQLTEVKDILKALQPEAKLFETQYGKTDISCIYGEAPFNYEKLRNSSLINKSLAREKRQKDKGEKEQEEFGITSFVYQELRPFSYEKFMNFLENDYPGALIRAKGYIWFEDDDIHTQLFEQAGRNVSITEISNWVAALPVNEQEEVFRNYPEVKKDWDETYGDRLNQIVFIGKGYERSSIIESLNLCLGEYKERG